jgi:drug/metabolite transporter (DMT)-like permease
MGSPSNLLLRPMWPSGCQYPTCMTTVQLGELAAIGTALLWTLSALAWTSAGKHIGTVALSFIRLVVAMLMLAVYGKLVRGLALPTDATPRTWLILASSGLMGFFVADLCLFKSFLLIGPRLSLLVLSLSPPIAALISWVFLSEALAARQWMAMAVTLGGIAWVVFEQQDSDKKPHERRGLRLGILLALAGAAGQAIGGVLSRHGIGDYDAAAATFIRILGGLAGYLVLITLLGRWPQTLAATGHRRAMFILTLGALVGPFAGVVLCMVAFRHCQAGIVLTIIATMPVLILPFSILLYREKVSLRAVSGAVISVFGVAMLVAPGEWWERVEIALKSLIAMH